MRWVDMWILWTFIWELIIAGLWNELRSSWQNHVVHGTFSTDNTWFADWQKPKKLFEAFFFNTTSNAKMVFMNKNKFPFK